MASSKFSIIYESVLITHFQAHHTPLLTALTWEGRQEAQTVRSSTNLESMRCSDDPWNPKFTVFKADTLNYLDFLDSKHSSGSNVAILYGADSGLPTKELKQF